MKLWNRHYTRREIESYVGDMRQIADIQLATLEDGMQRGTRIAQVRTGSGLDFTVLLDRAMDIGTATYNGMPLAWQSGTGAANPSRYEPDGTGWLRTFHGGLLALCGISQAGSPVPNLDPVYGEPLGLHGRIGAVPAHDVRVERVWQTAPDGEELWLMRLSGCVDEVSLFGHRLRLERTLEFTPGTPRFTIRDSVRNMGGQPAPLMVLYHCNFGWPLVEPESTLSSPASQIVPRDEAARAGLATWSAITAPVAGYAEQVFFHQVAANSGEQTVRISNLRLGITAALTFDTATLPYLTQWKQLGFADYTIGLEPGNCIPEGRVRAREYGRLQMLSPGETVTFRLAFAVSQGG
jgi:hypothetical protein